MTSFQVVVAIAAGLTVMSIAWKKAIWPFMRTFVAVGQTAATILEIGKQFEPDDGKSLHDRIGNIETNQTTLLRTQETQVGQIEELTTKVDSFILDRQIGGRRTNDPHGEI